MKFFKQQLAFVVLLLGSALSEEVLTLTEKNFQETIDNNQYILVEFYAPWCGHCKKLAPEYESAALALKDYDPKVILAKVDATEEKDLASKFQVKGFPTLKWFVNGEIAEYTGGRDEKKIVSWIKKKTGPAATLLKTVEDLNKFKDGSEAVAVGFFADEAEGASFLKNAAADDDTQYGVCYGDCSALVKDAGAVTSTKVMMLQKFDDGKALFEGDHTDSDALKDFVGANSLPTIVAFTQQSAPKIFGGPIKDQLLIFVDAHDSADTIDILKQVTPVAKVKKTEIMFVTVQKSDTRILEFFGVDESMIPTVRIINMAEGGAKKYKFAGTEITSKTVEKFIDDYFGGSLQMDLKSEEPLPESEQKDVRVVVGKDFDSVVNAPGKDVLVEFYAPWCGHCKKLEPEYDALAAHYKSNNNLVIAKVDSTANEVAAVQISGFPTIKFFPADSDEIVDYDGERTKDGMIKWLESNAKTVKSA